MTGHWSRPCRMAKHLVDLYQSSRKKIDKNVEANFTDQRDYSRFDPSRMTHLDVADYFEQANDKICPSDEFPNDDFKLLMDE